MNELRDEFRVLGDLLKDELANQVVWLKGELRREIGDDLRRILDEMTARLVEQGLELRRHTEKPTADGESARKTRVLVVDDSKSLVKPIIALLEYNGMQAEGAYSVHEAIERLETDDPYDVAVVDALMPKNGHTLAQHMLQYHTTVEVVMMSGDLEAAFTARKAKASAFVMKPFDNDQLVLAVERAADFRRLKARV